MKKRQKRDRRKPCYYCGKMKKHLTRDHFIPQHLGSLDKGNIVRSCLPCNELKDRRIPTTLEIKRFIAIFGHFPGYDAGKWLLRNQNVLMLNEYVPGKRSDMMALRINNKFEGMRTKLYKSIDQAAELAHFELGEIYLSMIH